MTTQPIVYLCQVDVDRWVLCEKGSAGAVAFAPYRGEPLTELCDLEGSPPELSEHNAFNPATEYPRTYGEVRRAPNGVTVFDGCRVDFSKPRDRSK